MTTPTDKVPSRPVFIDCETTGLSLDDHEIWEFALIEPDGTEHEWQLSVDLGRADPAALKVGGFHARRVTDDLLYGKLTFAEEVEYLTRGAHLVGAMVHFDAARLEKLLRANGACPDWHYHLIDVEAMMLGSIAWRALRRTRNGEETETAESLRELITPPWKSSDLSQAIGVDPDDPQFAKHTALGDARWVRAIYTMIVDGKAT